jgi:hypothetical protein
MSRTPEATEAAKAHHRDNQTFLSNGLFTKVTLMAIKYRQEFDDPSRKCEPINVLVRFFI